MLEKITESLVLAELYELNNKQDQRVKLFFLNYIKSLPYYYRYLIKVYMYSFNLLSFVFYLKLFSSLEVNKSVNFINLLLKYFPGFKIFKKFYRTIFMLSNYEK